MGLLGLHIAEQYVGTHRFGHKIGRHDQLRQRLGLLAVQVEEQLARAQDTAHIVNILAADRKAGKAAVLNGFDDGVERVLQPQHHHIGAVYHDIGRRGVVEFKDILDKLLFVALDGALLLADIDHQTDIILRYLLGILIGVNADEAQHAVGRFGQKPDDGAQHRCHRRQDTADKAGHLFGVVHGDALGHQLAENKGYVGQRQCDGDDRQRFKR